MNFPVWEVPFLGGGMLIGIIAVLHVFISHFAVGGGFFLVMTERKSYREDNPAMLEYVKKHSKFFMLLTIVLGAVTGVAIWFTIGLIHPSATSSLIHSFVWGWAIEWVFFLVEVASIIIYVATWEKMSRKAHLVIGWIYAASGFLTLAVINGIVSFMLTTGSWIETKDFWDGIFNPTYFPSLVARFALCIGLAGVYAFLTATRIKNTQARTAIIRYTAVWMLPALVVFPLALWWYYSLLPPAAQEIMNGGIVYIQTTTTYGVISAALLLLLVLIGPLWRPQSFNMSHAIILMLVAMVTMFSWERVREAVRKPYIIHGYMYSNSMLVDDVESIQEEGLLQKAKWLSERGFTEANELQLGKELFRAQCASCHTVGGYQDITPYLADREQEDIEIILSDLSSFAYMPPFGGNEQERAALAKWLVTLKSSTISNGGSQP